jgi:hypothetical protein
MTSEERLKALTADIAAGRIRAADFEIPEEPEMLTTALLPDGYKLGYLRGTRTVILTLAADARPEDLDASLGFLAALKRDVDGGAP